MMRRVGASALLLGLVVVPPVLLVVLGFREWGSLSLFGVADVRLLLALLTVVGWLAWLAWVVALVVEAIGLVAGRPRRAVRETPTGRGSVLAWPRTLAAGLLAVAFASQATPLATGAATPPARPAEPLAASGGVRVVGAADAPEETPVAARALAASARSVVHTVRSGDDLWSLAEHYYGSGSQWRQIVASNPSLGADPLADLTPGEQLTIDEPVTLVTVKPGDSLSKLALRHLGEGNRWPEIFRLNRDRIVDPDEIDIGWVLRVPLVTAAPVENQPPAEPEVLQQASAEHEPAEPEASEPSSPVELPPAGHPRMLPDVGRNGADGTAGGTAEALPPAIQSTEPTSDTVGPEVDRTAVVALVGGLSALTASAVMGGIAVRRRWQELARPLGRRIAPPDAELARFEAALGLARLDHEPDRQDLLERALRHLSRHWFTRGTPPPALAEVIVGDESGEFRFVTDPGSPPPGFQRVGDHLVVTWATLRELGEVSNPVSHPALVTLGEDADGDLVMVDLVESGTLGVRSEGSALASEALSAMLVELACAPWSAEVRLSVVTADESFAHVAGTHRVRTTTDVESAVAEVERIAADRRHRLGAQTWDDVRLDPDRADAWAPHVVLFESAPTPSQADRLQRAVEAVPVGVAAAMPVDEAAGEATWELTDGDGAHGVLGERTLVPQTIPTSTREAISSLYALADSTLTEPAPWWSSDDPEEAVNIVQLQPRHADVTAPKVLLLGPISLEGAAGEQPTRAVRSCIEYCAWLIENPGSTPSHMASELFVTDGTRRSNLSRLRSWLGSDPEGKPYLPEAYSGRMVLHPEVTSDWRDLLTLTAGGIDTMPLERLKSALGLVRGAPLADAAPGQWGWAEHLRSEMAALIRDAGVVAARLAREKGDLDTSRWAANRALMANPDDELLLGERIRTEQAAGRLDEVERFIGRLHRQSRLLGVDLLDETVDLIQATVEGRLRAREA